MKRLIWVFLCVFFLTQMIGCILGAESNPPELGYPVLYQLPNATWEQMMGYVIKTNDGQVIVIDGGTRGDAVQLSQLIRSGRSYGMVDAWFITHPHGDHMDALLEIVDNHPYIQISNIFASMLDLELIERYESHAQAADGRYHLFLEKKKDIYTELHIGDRFVFGDVILEILAVKNPEITNNLINNSSVVIRLDTGNVSALFLGDLGFEGGEKLLERYRGTGILRSDIVQIAHHGNYSVGVGREVYEEIAPYIALWPTTRWILWPEDKDWWRAYVVKGWMEELGVYSIFGFEGLARIELTKEELRRIRGQGLRNFTF